MVRDQILQSKNGPGPNFAIKNGPGPKIDQVDQILIAKFGPGPKFACKIWSRDQILLGPFLP